MTKLQQQRLLGSISLVCLIGVLAWFLLDSVEQNQPIENKQEPIVFDSIIEPVIEATELVEPLNDSMVESQESSGVIIDEAQPQLEAKQLIQAPSVARADAESNSASEPKLALEADPGLIAESEVEQTATTTASTEQQWVLQLASFSVRENADALSAKLKQLGYTPVIETTPSAGTLIYRVRLPPVTDRIKLQQTADTLSKELKLNAQILRHVP